MNGRGEAPDPRELARVLTGYLQEELQERPETPPQVLDPQSHRVIAGLLQEAAARTLDTAALWVGDALEHRNEPDFHYSIWRACRTPALMQEDSMRGGPATREIGTWADQNRYKDISESRTDALTGEFCQHLAGLHPGQGWVGESLFSMEQARDPGFRKELQEFIRERLQAREGRCLPEDARRLARRIAGDALCPPDRFTWGVVCALTHEPEEERKREDLVRELLGDTYREPPL